MAVADVNDRITTALREIEPGSQLEHACDRWEGFEHSVWQDGTWKLEGFITYFQSLQEMMRVLGFSVPQSLPAHCFNVEFVANLIGVSIDEFGVPSNGEPRLANDILTTRLLDSLEHLAKQSSVQAEAVSRIADHLVPPHNDIVDTAYVAQKLNLTKERITQMIRSGEIPTHCVLEGTGNGRLWKLDRKKIDQWIKNRPLKQGVTL